MRPDEVRQSTTAVREAASLLPSLWAMSAPIARFLRDRHRLDIHELPDPIRRKLASVAGVLYAAKRNARIGSHHLVDEDHSGFEFVDEALAFAVVFGPGAGAQAEAAIVRQANGLVDILNPK